MANGPTKTNAKTRMGIGLDFHTTYGASDSSIKFSDFVIVGESDAISVKVRILY